MPRFILVVLLGFLAAACPAIASAGLISLTVVGGITSVDGSTTIADPILQESLSGSTLTQLGSPLLFDPASLGGITVRLQNVSDQEIAFPDALPGVSVLTGVSGLTGYSSRSNVGAGGAGRVGGVGSEGTISRTVLDLTDSLEAFSSPASGEHGGGGGAATGVADNWISLTGASGADLESYLAGRHLLPGEWVDIPDFLRIVDFQRFADNARIAIGFDLPTFSSGGVSVTTGAWTGTFSGPALEEPPPPPDPVALPEPGSGPLLMSGLVALGLGGRRLAR